MRGKKSRLRDDEESSSQFQIPGPIYFDPDLDSGERELTVEEIFASQPPDLADDIHTIRDDSNGDDEQTPSDGDGDDDEDCDASFIPFLLDSARSRKRAVGRVSAPPSSSGAGGRSSRGSQGSSSVGHRRGRGGRSAGVHSSSTGGEWLLTGPAPGGSRIPTVIPSFGGHIAHRIWTQGLDSRPASRFRLRLSKARVMRLERFRWPSDEAR